MPTKCVAKIKYVIAKLSEMRYLIVRTNLTPFVVIYNAFQDITEPFAKYWS